MEKIIIDRFENEWAVCERKDMTKLHIKKINFPAEAKEGDCYLLSDSGEIFPDKERSSERAQKIKNLMDSLKEK